MLSSFSMPRSVSYTYPALEPHTPIRIFRNRYHEPHHIVPPPSQPYTSTVAAASKSRGLSVQSHPSEAPLGRSPADQPLHNDVWNQTRPFSSRLGVLQVRWVPGTPWNTLEHNVIAGRPTLLGVAERWGGSLGQKGTLQGRTHDVTTAQALSHGRYVLGGLSERPGSSYRAPSVHRDALGSGRVRVRDKGRTRV